MTTQNILDQIKKSAQKRTLYLPHAIRQMARPDRMISPGEIREVIEQGEIIEDYPSDPRGHSCLLFHYKAGDRPIHVVCAPKEDYLAVITAYIPTLQDWESDFKKRKKI